MQWEVSVYFRFQKLWRSWIFGTGRIAEPWKYLLYEQFLTVPSAYTKTRRLFPWRLCPGNKSWKSTWHGCKSHIFLSLVICSFTLIFFVTLEDIIFLGWDCFSIWRSTKEIMGTWSYCSCAKNVQNKACSICSSVQWI